MTKKEFKKLIDKHLIIDQKQNIPFGKLHNYISGIDKLYKAMNFTRCCMGEAEQLKCECKRATFTRTVDEDFNPMCGKCGRTL